jgi:hypothetical protein
MERHHRNFPFSIGKYFLVDENIYWWILSYRLKIEFLIPSLK